MTTIWPPGFRRWHHPPSEAPSVTGDTVAARIGTPSPAAGSQCLAARMRNMA
jgi:hypothetical protein